MLTFPFQELSTSVLHGAHTVIANLMDNTWSAHAEMLMSGVNPKVHKASKEGS
jgi:hypothetical protein